ncbi:uncharacterized protein LOC141909824 [Tubulanus polymorphus]|uniref:uncharacterized protein LOC141909824 n=1 Tax=Tubulanus polymorphus TaxID=672921 RepID=UPI003DA4F024
MALVCRRFASALLFCTMIFLPVQSSQLTEHEQNQLLEQIEIDTDEIIFDFKGYKIEIANSMRYWDNGTEIFIQVDNPEDGHSIIDENLGKTDETTTDGSELLTPSNETVVKRKIWAQERTLWANGFIPYCFTSGHFTNSDKQKIRVALRQIMAATCLTYSERSYCEKKAKMIRYKRTMNSCQSSIGQGKRGAGTNLGTNCMFTGTIIHETLHATGCWHEQQRTDRSAYVIVSENEYIYSDQFDFMETIDNAPFDYRSVMAYRGVGKRGRPAMFTVDPEMEFATTGGRLLTFYDNKQLNDVYKCAGRCGPNRCENEGYLDKNCKCVCPDFVRGTYCGQVSTGCGGVINVSGTKILTSPGYPSNYKNGQTCAWLVKAPKGSIMKIKFLDFDVEGSPTGCKDSLEVRYHGLGNVGPRYCGRGVKKTFETMFNNATIVLRTNSAGQRRGFKLQIDLKKDYSCNPNPCKNGGKCLKTLYGLIMCDCRFENVAGRWCEHTNGAWSQWGGWSNCPGRCGLQTRRRLCNSPRQTGRGLDCYGNSVESKPCGQWPCDGFFTCDFDKYSLGSTYCPLRQVQNLKADKFNGAVVSNTMAMSTVNSQRTPGRKSFAPHADLTLGNSKGMFFWSGLNYKWYKKGYEAWIVSPTISTAGARCLRFYFQSTYRGNPKLPGTIVGFKILRARDNEKIAGFSKLPIVTKYNKWTLFEETITDLEGVTPPYKVVIYFWWSSWPVGSLPGAAIDDISLLSGSCSIYEEMKYATEGTCKDKNPSCKAWAAKKECKKNPKYMRVNCPVSCEKCVPCIDADNKQCPIWAQKKECAKNPGYMLSQCPVSCQQCLHGCVDRNKDCRPWAKSGECSKNAKWMRTQCPRACGRCKPGFLIPNVCKGNKLLSDRRHTFTASSYSGKCLPQNAARDDADCNEWCSAENKAKGSWIQVKFNGGAKVVTSMSLWSGRTYVVKQATYKYSTDGVHWYGVFHRGTTNNVFEGNGNYYVQNFKAVYVRMYPKLWTPHDKACARWNADGCDAQDIEHES